MIFKFKLINITVSLEQVYKESSVEVDYQRQVNCVPCKGEGSSNGMKIQCTMCNGQGKRIQVMKMGHMIQQSITDCPNCNGTGQFVPENNKCSKCNGKGINMETRRRPILLKAGLEDGYKINLHEKGHQIKQGKGDLIVIIHLEKHKVFLRERQNLYTTVELSLYQAMCGFDKIITHLDGRKLHISSNGHTDYNFIRRIHDEGMYCLDNPTKGNLYIIFTVKIPNIKHLDKSIQEEWKESLSSFDTIEAEKEKSIKNDFSVYPTLLLDESNKNHLKSFQQLLEREHEPRQHHQEQEQTGPQCVQQ